MNARNATIVALAALAVSCGRPAGLENHRCPCLADAGYFCCEDTCIRIGQACPGVVAGSSDAARDAPASPDAAVDGPAVPEVPVSPPDAAPEAAPDATPEAAPDAAPDGAAVACGGQNQRCCPGNICENDGCCALGRCVGAFEACPGEAASCLTTTCGSVCGGLRERCCRGPMSASPDGGVSYCVRHWTTCVSERCQSCGNPGELCCDGACIPRNGATCVQQGSGPPRCVVTDGGSGGGG